VAQRFANGNQVLTDTGFGSWGAGFVEAVSGSSPITIQQTGHGYITGIPSTLLAQRNPASGQSP